MFDLKAPSATKDKPSLYRELAEQVAAVFTGERNAIANAANLASLIWYSLPDLNWAGFYFFDGKELVLGPFQGKVACVRIALNRGVCGTAAAARRSVIVEDVHAFPGHIACDAASNSEIVIPLVRDGDLLGVLDLDSPKPARFDSTDQAGLEKLAQLWIGLSD